MANNQLNTQQIEEMKRKLGLAQSSLDELRATIEMMEKSSLSSIETTHVGQMDRAVVYLLNYATGARKAVIAKLHGKP